VAVKCSNVRSDVHELVTALQPAFRSDTAGDVINCVQDKREMLRKQGTLKRAWAVTSDVRSGNKRRHARKMAWKLVRNT
jgi:hypothetical protein